MNRLLRMSLVGAMAYSLTGCGEPSASDYVQQGNTLYAEEKYGMALQEYKEAVLLAPDRPEPQINLGNTRYQLGDYLGAIEAPNSVLEDADPATQALIYYNQGNAHFRMNEFDAAIEAYKQTLRRTPDDQDAKYNLELAQKILEQQQQQQQQAGGGEGQPQPEQGQGEQQPQGGGNQEDPQQQQGGGNQDQQQPPNAPPSNLSPDEAERALDRLRRSEERNAEDNYDNYAVGGDQDGDQPGQRPSDSGW